MTTTKRETAAPPPPEVSIWNTDHHQAERYTGTEWEQDDWPHLLPPPHVHREIHTTWTSGVTMREETEGAKRPERPGEAVHGQVGTHWPHYIACDFELIEWKTPRCKSCGDPREDNLRGCEDYDETICDDCAFVLALARIRQAMAMARMREQPPCPWIASLKADEV